MTFEPFFFFIKFLQHPLSNNDTYDSSEVMSALVAVIMTTIVVLPLLLVILVLIKINGVLFA